VVLACGANTLVSRRHGHRSGTGPSLSISGRAGKLSRHQQSATSPRRRDGVRLPRHSSGALEPLPVARAARLHSAPNQHVKHCASVCNAMRSCTPAHTARDRALSHSHSPQAPGPVLGTSPNPIHTLLPTGHAFLPTSHALLPTGHATRDASHNIQPVTALGTARTSTMVHWCSRLRRSAVRGPALQDVWDGSPVGRGTSHYTSGFVPRRPGSLRDVREPP